MFNFLSVCRPMSPSMLILHRSVCVRLLSFFSACSSSCTFLTLLSGQHSFVPVLWASSLPSGNDWFTKVDFHLLLVIISQLIKLEGSNQINQINHLCPVIDPSPSCECMYVFSVSVCSCPSHGGAASQQVSGCTPQAKQAHNSRLYRTCCQIVS